MYIDSHCHIDGTKFASDREAMLERARAAGIHRMLAIGNGEGPGTFDCAIPYAEKYDWIYATIGIHPHEAKIANQAAYDEMAQLARHPKVLAWGEIGLDYHYDFSPRDVQQRVFIEQMELARAARKPIIIHCRPSDNSENAWDDCLRLLREHWAPTGLGGILHCFTGTVAHAHAALDIGFVVSFAGNITYPKAQNIRDAAAVVPLDRFFIETDCPYLAPIPHRGKRNEPAFVVETARQVGQLRRISGEEAGLNAAQNFERFFNLPPLAE
jgi:TatD DNase family protein